LLASFEIYIYICTEKCDSAQELLRKNEREERLNKGEKEKVTTLFIHFNFNY